MLLDRILVGRRSVDLAGRRFVVRPPTVRTFYLALQLFGQEIGIIRTAASKQADGQISPAVAVGLFLMRADALRALLATCVDGELETARTSDDLAQLALAACEQFSPAAMAVLMSPPGVPVVDDDDSDAADVLLACAESWHCKPSEVLDEPLDLYAVFVKTRSEANAAKSPGSNRFSGTFGRPPAAGPRPTVKV